MIEIVATIGYTKTNIVELIDELIFLKINSFRFNISKYYDLLDLEKYLDLIIAIKRRYGSKIKIMLDLPYPYQKCRIYTDATVKLCSGTICYISSIRNLTKIHRIIDIKTNASDFGKYLKNGDKIIYGDGRHAFLVNKIINSNCVEVRLVNDTIIYPGKSIHIKNFSIKGSLNNSIIKKICLLKPDCIALSFVSASNSIEKAQNMFEGINVVSKIETQEGVDNIRNLSKMSDIMIGRGDLLLNVDYRLFLEYQKSIAISAKENSKKLYVATGILSSLSTSLIPTQSEIVDLLELKRLDPSALVLNYGLIQGNLKEALQIIDMIFN